MSSFKLFCIAVLFHLVFFTHAVSRDVAHWNFDRIEADGLVRDQVGFAHAQLYGEQEEGWIVPGVHGNAMLFDTGRRYLKINTEHAPDLENDFTVYYVIKPYQVGGFRTILWKGNRQVDPEAVNYVFDLRDGKVELKTKDATGQWVVYASPPVIHENEWHEVYIHFRDGVTRIVVNGEEQRVGVYEGGQREQQLLANDYPAYIGQGANPRTSSFFFDGLIDELKISTGNTIDLSAAKKREWKEQLVRYQDKLNAYLEEKDRAENERLRELQQLAARLRRQHAVSPHAPFYALVLPDAQRIYKRPEFVEDLVGLPRAASLSAASNEVEGFQIIVVGNPERDIEGVEVVLSDLVSAQGEVLGVAQMEWGWIKSVQSEKPSIPVEFVGYIPDVIMNGAGAFSVAASDFTPVHVRVRVPEATPAGLYEGQVEIRSADFVDTVPVKLRVYDFSLPKKGSLPIAFSFFESFYAEWYDLEQIPDERKRAIYEFLLSYRISPNNIYTKEDIYPEPRFLEEMKGRTNFFTIRGWGGGVLKGEALARKMEKYADIMQTVKELGMEEDMYFYGADELSYHLERGLRGAQQAHREMSAAYPQLRMMQTSNPIPELRDLFNVWVPNIRYYDQESLLQELEVLRRRGDEIWWYTADDPQSPMPNFFLDYPVFDCRIIMTLSYMYQVDGILYWCINREWKTNLDIRGQWPDAQWRPYIYHTHHGTRKWRNGMGNFMYPAPDGSMYPSLRLENLRDGLEDYEYLVYLERLADELEMRGSHPEHVKQARELLSVPPQVAVAVNQYNTHPREFLQFRNAVGLKIEELQQLLVQE